MERLNDEKESKKKEERDRDAHRMIRVPRDHQMNQQWNVGYHNSIFFGIIST